MRSSISKRWAAVFALLCVGGVFSAWSCGSLDDVEARSCGNYVLEPKEGEDCDHENGPDGTLLDGGPDSGVQGICGQPSEPGACRFLCKFNDTDQKCPDKDEKTGADTFFGCGIDGICRRPFKLSESPVTVGQGNARRLFSGDFDHDGRTDAVAVGGSELTVHYFATSGFIDRSVAIPNEERFPAFGDIDGDGVTDIVLNLRDSIGVLAGQPDRTFVPKGYPTTLLPAGYERLVPLGTVNGNQVVLSFVDSTPDNGLETNVYAISAMKASTATRPDLTRDKDPAFGPFAGGIVGAIGVSRRALGDTKCSTVAFMNGGATPTLNVLHCTLAGEFAPLQKIPLSPGETPWAGVFFADNNNDGIEDIVYGVDPPTEFARPELRVRTVDAAGSVGVQGLLVKQVDDVCGTLPNGLLGDPLAVADLDGDGHADIVDTKGVWFAPGDTTTFTRKCIDPAGNFMWRTAVVGDFDGNHEQDVFLARANLPIIDVWSGTGGRSFKTLTISTDVPIEEMVRGDFDGDTFDDVILRSVKSPGDMENPPQLMTIFGGPGGLPESASLLGLFDSRPTHIVAANLVGQTTLQELDPMTDLLVLSSSPGQLTALSLVAGHPRRRLLAPMQVTELPETRIGTTGQTDLIEVVQVVVSTYGATGCTDPQQIGQGGNTRNRIAMMGKGAAWLVGCGPLGKSVKEPKPTVDQVDGKNQLLVPLNDVNVNKDPNQQPPDDLLALFIDATNQTRIYANDPETGGLLWRTEAALATTQAPVSLSLPQSSGFDAPFRVVDIDGDGKREIAFLGQSTGPGVYGKLVVVRNDSGEGVSAKERLRRFREYDLAPILKRDTSDDPGKKRIFDIEFLDTDGDRRKDFVVSTGFGVFVVTAINEPANDATYPIGFHFAEPTQLAEIEEGGALLAIDANSDGVEDLLVSERNRLLLYLGKEEGR